MATLKTKDEIEKLKRNWESDPCWDIEKTESFEAHHDELLAYRLEKEAKWEQERFDEIDNKALELQCSFELAEYIMGLERQLASMNEAIETVYYRTH